MDIENGFYFAGKHTGEFSMYAEYYPAQKTPARKHQTVSVPGRSGDLHFAEDAFENFIQPYECYFHGKLPTPEQSHAVKAWLSAAPGYHRLEDAYDPKHFHLASFWGPMDIENTLNEFGRCVVNFDCMPQAYLISGEQKLSYEAPGAIDNPTLFTALPIITVYGTGPGTVTIGSCTVEIKKITQPIILDCDTQNAYSQPGEGAPEPQNSNIKAIPFPALEPGSNPIAFDGGITKLEIVPRWWEI